jgi:CHAT domain-containing protein/Tfp pilus assembly protein PilF
MPVQISGSQFGQSTVSNFPARGIVAFGVAVFFGVLFLSALVPRATPYRGVLPTTTGVALLTRDDPCLDPALLVSQADQLRTLWTEASLREAAGKYTQAGVCWKQSGLLREEANALKSAGDVYITLGEYTKAREAFAAAVEIRRQLDDRRAEAEALARLGFVWSYQAKTEGEFQNALDSSNQALSLAQAINDKPLQAQALNNIGKVSYRRGQPSEAMTAFTAALDLIGESPSPAVEAQLKLDVGTIYSDQGDLELALTTYQSALTLWQSVGHPCGQASALTNIGRLLTLLGERQQALEKQTQALALSQPTGDVFGLARILNNFGFLYEVLGETDLALGCYLQTYDIFADPRLDLPGGQAASLRYIGGIYESRGQIQEAQKKYEDYLAIALSIKSSPLEADARNRLGALFFTQGKTAEALDQYQRALVPFQKVGNQRGQAYVLNNIGYLYDVAGKDQEALEQYNRALPFLVSVKDREAEAQTLFNIARAERDLGKIDPARTHIESALGLVESLRSKVGTPDLRASYFASVHQLYELQIDLLMRSHKARPNEGFDARALRTSERARARSLLDMLMNADINVDLSDNPALTERARLLRTTLAAKATAQIKLLSGKHTDDQSAALAGEIRDLTIKYNELESRIKAKDPHYAFLSEPLTLSIEEIQQQVLDKDTVLLEYSLGDERSYVWVVRQNTFVSYELPGRKAIEKASRNLYDLLIARQTLQQPSGIINRDLLAKADRDYEQQATELSEMLLGRVAAMLGSSKLLIVTDGALQYVPFGALPLPNKLPSEVPAAPTYASHGPAESAPLILEHDVVILPSASVLSVQRRDKRSNVSNGKTVAVLADPVFQKDDPRLSTTAKRRPKAAAPLKTQSGPSDLNRSLRDFGNQPGEFSLVRLVATRQEADAILAIAPSGTSLKAMDFKANRAMAISAELKKYRILHFATHGLLNSKHPELSGIVLSLLDEKGNPQDGFLRLQDVYNLRLPVDLVVLSACNTGLGKDLRGEGLIGLTRGFMYAGSKRVVSSLWKVDDEATAELMTRFYVGMLKENLAPAAALRAAQLAVRKQKRWRAPFYWAGFVLHGESR